MKLKLINFVKKYSILPPNSSRIAYQSILGLNPDTFTETSTILRENSKIVDKEYIKYIEKIRKDIY